MDQTPSLSSDQLQSYLAHIRYHGERDPTLKTLNGLMKRHLATCPFENLDIHYTAQHNILLDIDSLHVKVVTRGRGGYCMEMNGYFAAVLRSLGFSLYATGARIAENKEAEYGGITHCVNLVTIDDTKYLCDVAFGGNGIINALALVSGAIVQNLTEEVCLIYEPFKYSSRKEEKVWQYRYRIKPGDSWTYGYSFTEAEFFTSDLKAPNYWCSTHPDSWFTRRLICATILCNGDGDANGRMILNDKVLKRRLVGQGDEIMAELSTEIDRIQALSRWFDINLTETEQSSILGRQSALPNEVSCTM